jgi:hypothetical protein
VSVQAKMALVLAVLAVLVDALRALRKWKTRWKKRLPMMDSKLPQNQVYHSRSFSRLPDFEGFARAVFVI